MLFPLKVRECDGVRGGSGIWSSCFLEVLSLRAGATGVDLVVMGLGGGSSHGAYVDDTGEVTGVEDAMVPPTPVRDVAGVILSGAYLVMEHDVGGMMAAGEITAGLCGELIAITKLTLELDAALSLRSGGEESWTGVLAVVDPAEPARGRCEAGGKGEKELVTMSRKSWEVCTAGVRTLDAILSLRDLVGSGDEAC